MTMTSTLTLSFLKQKWSTLHQRIFLHEGNSITTSRFRQICPHLSFRVEVKVKILQKYVKSKFKTYDKPPKFPDLKIIETEIRPSLYSICSSVYSFSFSRVFNLNLET